VNRANKRKGWNLSTYYSIHHPEFQLEKGPQCLYQDKGDAIQKLAGNWCSQLCFLPSFSVSPHLEAESLPGQLLLRQVEELSLDQKWCLRVEKLKRLSYFGSGSNQEDMLDGYHPLLNNMMGIWHVGFPQGVFKNWLSEFAQCTTSKRSSTPEACPIDTNELLSAGRSPGWSKATLQAKYKRANLENQ
jgi:hypothetical protein